MLHSLWHKIRQHKTNQSPDSNTQASSGSLSPKALLGKAGEETVKQWLIQQGYTIKAQNYRTKRGEVDIIAQKDEVLAFIEVKLRNTPYFPMTELIIPAKQHKIIKTARAYCTHYAISDMVLRFDVALVCLAPNEPSITYITNAFTASQC